MGFFQDRNKQGGSSGGSSSGRSSHKRGGREYAADPVDAEDLGPLTCPTCAGGGRITRPQAERDEEGMFDGDATARCPECKGRGVVRGR